MVPEITPLMGSIDRPSGSPVAEYVRTLAGMSASPTEIGRETVSASACVCGPGSVTTGAMFTSLTVMVTGWVSLSDGDPLSDT